MTNTTDSCRKKNALKTIVRTIVYAFSLFGLLFILILFGVLSIMNPSAKISGVPDSAVLSINFNTDYAELRSDDFFAEFTDQSVYSVFDVVRAINIAATDSRIKALSATINTTSLGMAQVQEIADAVKFFRSTGKKAYAYSQGMGSFGRGTREYYLATAFDEIWMQPNSDIGLTGISIEVPFMKNILQKIGIEPEFYTRYEYKTAVASFLNSHFTPAYKEELQKLGNGLYGQITKEIALNRNLTVDEVKTLIDNAPLFAEDALRQNLINGIDYQQELNSILKKAYNAEIFNITDYMAHIDDYYGKKLPEIAFLVLEGVIEAGKSANNPMEEALVGSSTIIAQLEELSKKENLKALVLRVNSPGGSYIASAEIWHAIKKFKTEKNIPVVVTMGDYAASGGYFVSLAGDYIIAEPATVTGSIGVLGGKVVLEEFWKKLNIGWGEVNFGKNAGILSVNHKFSQAEKEIFNRSLDRIYKDFTNKVSQARHIDIAQMDKIARGRIWLGQEALELGLIDAVGGIDFAIKKAKELSGMSYDEEFGLSYYPRRESFQEKLTRYLENGGGLPAMQILQNSGIDASDIQMFQRLRHEAVLPPMKIEM